MDYRTILIESIRNYSELLEKEKRKPRKNVKIMRIYTKAIQHTMNHYLSLDAVSFPSRNQSKLLGNTLP